MSCYHPLLAYRTSTGVVFAERRSGGDFIGSIELPCGQCIGCRMRKASDWALRVMHEAQCWPDNCFVTLTYGRDRLPPYGSLEHRDFQLFMKRLRKHVGVPVRFYMCGEYGPLNLRPHYHACLFNVNFRSDRVVAGKSASGAVYYDSDELSKLWSHGRVSVQDLTKETAGYCARYIMKKVLGEQAQSAYSRLDGDTGELIPVKPEYAAMSLKPGIGALWFEKYHRDVYTGDFVVSGGVKSRPPKYYDKLKERSDVAKRREGVSWEEVYKMDLVGVRRAERAVASIPENTPERRIARETVHEARVTTLRRDFES